MEEGVKEEEVAAAMKADEERKCSWTGWHTSRNVEGCEKNRSKEANGSVQKYNARWMESKHPNSDIQEHGWHLGFWELQEQQTDLIQVEEKYIRLVKDMNKDSKTLVRCAAGNTEEFEVTVGLHHGMALSPFPFAVIVDYMMG